MPSWSEYFGATCLLPQLGGTAAVFLWRHNRNITVVVKMPFWRATPRVLICAVSHGRHKRRWFWSKQFPMASVIVDLLRFEGGVKHGHLFQIQPTKPFFGLHTTVLEILWPVVGGRWHCLGVRYDGQTVMTRQTRSHLSVATPLGALEVGARLMRVRSRKVGQLWLVRFDCCWCRAHCWQLLRRRPFLPQNAVKGIEYNVFRHAKWRGSILNKSDTTRRKSGKKGKKSCKLVGGK